MPRLLNGIKAEKGHSYRSIEIEAASLRKQLELEYGQPILGKIIFERIGRVSVKFNEQLFKYSYSVEFMPLGVEARSYYDTRSKEIVIALSEDTYFDLENDVPRAKFTVCHELGHAWMHISELTNPKMLLHLKEKTLNRGSQRHAAFQDTEWQANAFAGAFLMPADAVALVEKKCGGDLGLLEYGIEQRFGVSREASVRRAKIYSDHKGELLIATKSNL